MDWNNDIKEQMLNKSLDTTMKAREKNIVMRQIRCGKISIKIIAAKGYSHDKFCT